MGQGTGVDTGLAMADRIAHYTILDRLGAGGMGEVYRAHDERLQRDVALKVLLPGAVADETARARLLREARTASALNHAHIAHIYEVGKSVGRAYIAMELVEGRTLREAIPADGLPAETAIRHGAQIADALAHEKGVVHREKGLLYARLGDRERAFAQIERSLERRDDALLRLKGEPGFKSLRGDPRFNDLLRRIGLPAAVS